MEKNLNECPRCDKPVIRDVVREKVIIRCSDQECFVKGRMEEIAEFVKKYKAKPA